MLNEKNFKQGIMGLYASFQHKGNMSPPSKMTLDIWYQALSDIPDEAFQKACIFIIRNHDWFPTVKDIREAAGFACDVESGSDTIAEQQWEVFRAKFSSVGTNRMRTAFYEGEQIFEDPTTQHVAELIFEDFGRSNESEAGNWRARFISTYNNVKQNGRRTAEMKSIGSFKAIQGGNQKAVGA